MRSQPHSSLFLAKPITSNHTGQKEEATVQMVSPWGTCEGPRGSHSQSHLPSKLTLSRARQRRLCQPRHHSGSFGTDKCEWVPWEAGLRGGSASWSPGGKEHEDDSITQHSFIENSCPLLPAVAHALAIDVPRVTPFYFAYF